METRICKCGRVHFMDDSIIQRALDNNSDVIFICANCGNAIRIGADSYYNTFEYGESVRVHDMYASPVGKFTREVTYNSVDASIFIAGSADETCKAVSEIIYSKGVGVPMKTGEYANAFGPVGFLDTSCPDLYKIDRPDVQPSEVHEFISEFYKNSRLVDIHRLRMELTESQKKALSKLYIRQINWKGTPYETQYNSLD